MDLNKDTDFNLQDIIQGLKSSFKRYWLVAVWPAGGLLFLAFLLAYRLPDFFVSKAIIFAEPRKVTIKLLPEEQKDSLGERMESLVQLILSSKKLGEIASRFKLYPEYVGLQAEEKRLMRFRSDIEIGKVQSVTGGQLIQTFSLAFKYRDPEITHQVANSLVELFLSEAGNATTAQLSTTSNWLDAEVGDARRRLEQKEKSLQRFTEENFGKLPEQFEAVTSRLVNAQKALDMNRTRLDALSEERGLRQREMAEMRSSGAGGGLSGGEDTSSLSPADNLAQLERALIILKSKYSSEHPDVIRTAERIQALRRQLQVEQQSDNQGESRPAPRIETPAQTRLRERINELTIEINSLKKENDRLESTIAEFEKDIEGMPLIKQQLVDIMRDYEVEKDKYEALSKEREMVALRESMVRLQSDAQFSVIEEAKLPTVPAGPNRLLIAGGGVFAFIGSFCGIIIGIFFLNGAYRDRESIEADLGIEVIGVIPPLVTQHSKQHQIQAAIWAMAISAAFLILGVILIYVITS